MTLRSPRALAIAAVLSSIAFPVLAAPQPASTPAAKDDPVLAIVNGKDIHKSTVIAALRANPNLQQVSYPQVLDQVVMAELVLQQATKQKVDDDAQFKQLLKDNKDDLMRQFWINKQIKAQAAVLPENQVKDTYDNWVKNLPPREEVRAHDILSPTEEAGRAVLADLKAGKSFEEEVKAKANGQAKQGEGDPSDLGYFSGADRYGPEVWKAVENMKAGEVTQYPVKVPGGWVVLKVDDRRPVTPPAFDQVKEQIRLQLAQGEFTKTLEPLRKSAAVKLFNQDGTPLTEAAPDANAPGKPAAPKN